MGGRRSSYQTGHRPKFLVVIDGSAESAQAIAFAARRAARTKAIMMLLSIVEVEQSQEWLAVSEMMRQEGEDRANDQLELAATRARELVDVEAERVVRFGPKLEQILGLIEEDPDISLLVLAAASGPDGPGPLVTMMAGKAAGTFPIPVVIVPGALSDEDIEALA
ncbi:MULTISPECIES: universal stress protein [unclassified Beijerinckia]|uniref:universal stress protein n=1 Tax=unclassified Beijerinckia TaxID=2638183 RepID=UPI00089D4687|nr:MULTISPECIES: universal stress protein [unclassified Beijerinckia]MDH7797968.1 nucleotide-binding universal stress UspA family protein [Beijerinckia sp. GAS462]SED04443.1 Nucleotide-binding universal stress protein, UspA family [Beijerinckia sp. 28-YEA-48]